MGVYMRVLTELQRSYWSGVHRGRHIAVAHTANVWLVYLDHVLQDNARFRTFEEAHSWLCRKVDAARARAPNFSRHLRHARARTWYRPQHVG
jgi:hypothetical protein